jgi:hypothetical protein
MFLPCGRNNKKSQCRKCRNRLLRRAGVKIKKSSGRNRDNQFLHRLKTKISCRRPKTNTFAFLRNWPLSSKIGGARVGCEKILGSHRPTATRRQLQRARQHLANAAPTYFPPSSATPVDIACNPLISYSYPVDLLSFKILFALLHVCKFSFSF